LVLVLLLCSGDKRSQSSDIERAAEYWPTRRRWTPPRFTAPSRRTGQPWAAQPSALASPFATGLSAGADGGGVLEQTVEILRLFLLNRFSGGG